MIFKDMRLASDATHGLSVEVVASGCMCRIHSCHSPRRNQVHTYRAELRELVQQNADKKGVYEFYARDLNRHAVERPDTRLHCAAHGLRVHDSTQGRLH